MFRFLLGGGGGGVERLHYGVGFRAQGFLSRVPLRQRVLKGLGLRVDPRHQSVGCRVLSFGLRVAFKGSFK